MTYWQDYPPTHVLVSAYLMGGKRSSAGKLKKELNQTKFADLTQAVNSVGGVVNHRLPQAYKT